VYRASTSGIVGRVRAIEAYSHPSYDEYGTRARSTVGVDRLQAMGDSAAATASRLLKRAGDCGPTRGITVESLTKPVAEKHLRRTGAPALAAFAKHCITEA
jgi:hypothetical protein